MNDKANRIQRWPVRLLWALPLVLALALPGVGVLGSLAVVIAMLVFYRDARNATPVSYTHLTLPTNREV